MAKRLMMVIGAGVSLATNEEGAPFPNKMPSTADLTQFLFSEETLDKFELPRTRFQLHKVKKYHSFMRCIKELVKDYYESDMVSYDESEFEPNYEQIYTVALMVWNAKHLIPPHPEAFPLMKKLKSKFNQKGSNHISFGSYLSHLFSYIEFVVHGILKRTTRTKLDNLETWKDRWKLILNLVNNESFDCLEIFSLNHDTLLEGFLNSHGYKFNDGFDYDSGDKFGGERICYWDPEHYKSSDRVRIYKLHGSINSYWDSGVNHPNWPENDFLVKIDKSPDFDPLSPETSTLLMGTNNKFFQYNRAHNFDLQHLYRQRLRNSDALIISGYSFGDLGINTALTNRWLNDESKPPPIVIGSKRNFEKQALGEIRYELENLDFNSVPDLFQDVHELPMDF